MRRQFLQGTSQAILAGVFCLVGFTGCSITTHDKGDGKKDDVDIRTPFGSLSVKEGKSDVKDTGLTLYPGARPRKDSDDDKNSANVNISSSFFGLKVVALEFASDDPSDKVLAFYRKDMGKYGKVLDCTGGFSMNFEHHDKNSEVTCDGHGSDHDYKKELKVGTENNQRVVAVKPRSSGSEFTLVYVRAQGSKDTN
ncbi:MAG TPA: hypothetical protein VGN44_06630 [Candidatus Angelobacter sp.]|jgi:hypothetical protein